MLDNTCESGNTGGITIEKILQDREANGLSPISIKLHFENHIITDPERDNILELQERYPAINILTGEFSLDSVSSLLEGELLPFNNILFNGFGCTEKEIEEGKDNIHEIIINRGIPLVLIDCSVGNLEIQPSYTTLFKNLLLSVAISSQASKYLNSQTKDLGDISSRKTSKENLDYNPDRRKFLGAVAKTIAAFSVTALGSSYALQKISLNPEIMEQEGKIQIGLESIIKDPAFVSFTEGVVNLRNLIMATNLMYEARYISTKDNKPLNFIFTAGTGHINIQKKLDSETPEKIQSDLRDYAKKLFNETFENLYKKTEEGLMRESEVVLFIGSFAKMFTNPAIIQNEDYIKIIRDDPKYKNAQEIMVEEFNIKLSSLTQNDSGTTRLKLMYMISEIITKSFQENSLNLHQIERVLNINNDYIPETSEIELPQGTTLDSIDLNQNDINIIK